MVKPHSLRSEEDFARLWVNECQRVFMDRLNADNDRLFFKELIMSLVGKFKGSWSIESIFVN